MSRDEGQPFPVQPWMTAAPVARLFAALGAPGIDVRFVGGCVRNAVMALPVGEIDIATPEVPAVVAARLARAGLRAIPTGIDHGTVTALVDDGAYEVTTLRRDTACDGRHAEVAFTTDWREDAGRRDFTFNALSLRPDGTLFDYYAGIADAQAGRVRFVGIPADRIREDYLRILRLFRFLAWYGREAPDQATLAACRTHGGGLAHLSAERVSQELVKILAAPAPAPILAMMDDCGALAQVLPEATEGLARLAALARVESAVGAGTDWRRRLAGCITSAGAAHLAGRLRLSNADAAYLARLVAPEPLLDAFTPPRVLRAALYRHGADIAHDRLLLAWAGAKGGTGDDPARWRAQLDEVRAWRPRTLPVSGADVLALGIAPGPAVGALLGAVEDWWIGEDFVPSRDRLLAELKARARA